MKKRAQTVNPLSEEAMQQLWEKQRQKNPLHPEFMRGIQEKWKRTNPLSPEFIKRMQKQQKKQPSRSRVYDFLMKAAYKIEYESSV